ncbi:uncharacterized protein LOC141944670 isoform X1 [Strix uralensis]
MFHKPEITDKSWKRLWAAQRCSCCHTTNHNPKFSALPHTPASGTGLGWIGWHESGQEGAFPSLDRRAKLLSALKSLLICRPSGLLGHPRCPHRGQGSYPELCRDLGGYQHLPLRSPGPRDAPYPSSCMAVDWLGFGYAALVASGGLIGYAKAGSVPSLAAGLFFGSLAGLGAYQLSQNPSNVWISLITSGTLTAVMGTRFYNSGKFMPAGLIAGVSLLMVGRLALKMVEKPHDK